MYDKATDPLGFPDAQERVSKLDTCAHWWHFPGTCCALRPERPEMKHASLKCPAGSETRHLESQARQDLRRRRGTFSDPGHLDHVVTQQKTFDSKAQTLGPKLCQIDPATGHSRSRCCRKPDKYIYIYILLQSAYSSHDPEDTRQMHIWTFTRLPYPLPRRLRRGYRHHLPIPP